MMREPILHTGQQTEKLFGGAQPPRKIAVFRALHLGDMLCVVPALRALRAAAPLSNIKLIGLPWATAFVKRFGKYLDELLVFPGLPTFPEQPVHLNAIPHFLSEMQRERFDLAIQMHGDGSLSNPLVVLFAADHSAGFYLPGRYCPDPHTFLTWDEREHEVLRYLRLVEFLGVAPQGEHLEFPLSETDYRTLQRRLSNLPAPGSYVCIHPGAWLPSRRWLPQRFAEVADRLAERGMKIVLTGSAEEADVLREVQRAIRMPALDLGGKTDMGALGALIARARLVVANDTGISYMAAALATPSVIVSSGADSERWAPLDRERHQVVVSTDVACRPCTHEVCPTGHQGAKEVEEVAAMVTRILNNLQVS